MHATAARLAMSFQDPAAMTSAPRRLQFLRSAGASGDPGHDARSKATVAEGLAELLGYHCEPMGVLDSRPSLPTAGRTAAADGEPVFLVPQDTLVGPQAARDHGVRGLQDLFGGVVPHAFVATKAITHSLWPQGTAAPAGWVSAFGERVADVVLPGYTVFDHEAAREAGRHLLRDGPVRLKDTGGIGGLGQTVVREVEALDRELDAIDVNTLVQHGWVLERNLQHVRTFSVGLLQVGPYTAAYVGTQQLTCNGRGQEVYGGSRLRVVRGGFDRLLALVLTQAERTAIQQARVYHLAAAASFDGFFASRCNYDVACGIDVAGQAQSGVLEQSWRIGGASGAELMALRAFRDDPTCQQAIVENVEVYGGVEVPEDAWVYYDDVDAKVGRLTKYARRLDR